MIKLFLKKELLTYEYDDLHYSTYLRMFYVPVNPPFVIASSTIYGYSLLYLKYLSTEPYFSFFHYMCRKSGEVTQSDYFHYGSLRKLVMQKRF